MSQNAPEALEPVEYHRKIWYLILEYMENSTIHGLKYIFPSVQEQREKDRERRKSLQQKDCILNDCFSFKRLFWVIIFLLSATLCIMLINKVWTKYQNSPVIVSFSEKYVPVEKVPFPSITLCPNVKINPKYNFTEEYIKYFQNATFRNDYKNHNETIKRAMEAVQDISLICPTRTIQGIFNTLNYTIGRDFTDGTIIENMEKVHTDMHEKLRWLDKLSLRLNYATILTEEGHCINKNVLAATEIFREENLRPNYPLSNAAQRSKGWDLVKGYTNGSANVYPLRTTGEASRIVLFLKLPKTDKYDFCNAGLTGFNIYLQHPADHPQALRHFYVASPGKTTSLALKFQSISASSDLHKFGVDVRKCYLPGERYLKYFKIYTPNNCRLECLSNYTYETCGCVSFYMPPIYRAEIFEAYSNDLPDKCSCLLTCEEILYDAEVYESPFDIEKLASHLRATGFQNKMDLEEYDYFRLDIYFKESSFLSIQRSELYTISELFGNIGGLLGLCLGVSFFSILEILHYVIIGFKVTKDEVEVTIDEKYKSHDIEIK
ncbi:pickpocket protein 28-like isoform X2 [Galleria mellonella]|uniref:Pickpocket protein 28-like isoform X2 n=1 Tax=Galleria mellonella TaxID=7137 RepID=A0A6J1WL26_GALME|nr:pickpocket protein 28-like isoform X2 [Galleria mellonella]